MQNKCNKTTFLFRKPTSEKVACPNFNFQFHYMTLGSPDLVVKMLLSDLGLITDASLLVYRDQPILDPSVDQK